MISKIQNDFSQKIFCTIQKAYYICTRNKAIATGALAQLVEQRTENPCVPGSIPGGTTTKPHSFNYEVFFIKFYHKKRFESVDSNL